jgi:hypothetical protein
LRKRASLPDWAILVWQPIYLGGLLPLCEALHDL